MLKWLWENAALPTIGAVLELTPWYVWVVAFGVVCAIAWKAYRFLGWPGLVGIGLAVLTFGAYRQGWVNASQRHSADKFTPPAKKPRPTIFKPKSVKRKYNTDLNIWE